MKKDLVIKYIDISEKIKFDIFNNNLCNNAVLPSIRKLADKYNVNSATIVRALEILKSQDLIYPYRTKGYFINDNILDIRLKLAKEESAKFLKQMQLMGFNNSETLDLLRKECGKWESVSD